MIKRISTAGRIFGSMVLMGCMFQTLAAQPARSLDQCIPGNLLETRAAWRPMSGSPPADLVLTNGEKTLRFPCNFQTNATARASWDQRIDLDLSQADGIEFKVLCRNPEPMQYFAIYFEGKNGWYSGSFFPEWNDRWDTIRLAKSDFNIEGEPGGWEKLRTLRISAWKSGNSNTEFLVKDLKATGELGSDAFVVVLKGKAEDRADEIAERVVAYLRAGRIGSVLIPDTEVTPSQLKKARLVVLPHNSDLPETTVRALLGYLGGGGKALAFYSVPQALQPALNLGPAKAIKAPAEGSFSRIRLRPGALPGAPSELAQTSGWISAMAPVPGKNRVLADWLDANGKPGGQPALIASTNCILMTHVLLSRDRSACQQLLLAMAGFLVPDLLDQPVAARLAEIGQLGGCQTFEQLTNKLARMSLDNRAARQSLNQGVRVRNAAVQSAARKQNIQALAQAEEAATRMERAFCAAQKPEAGEFRAFWCHSAFGVRGMSWDEAIGKLAANGFNAILPNMLWGGAAFYPSEFLPAGRGLEKGGDQVRECLDACRKHGVAMHVWKVNWNLGSYAPQSFIDRMRREGRLQESLSGEERTWLCPSHPANRKLEVDAMVELARKYPLDGLHFDYIRYPGNDHCFCGRCRKSFEEASGLKVEDWSKILEGPAKERWQKWRQDNITALVKAVSEQARAVRPGIKISAAVFPEWAVDRQSVAQDWKLWCERGYLDFVCPMDYSESDRRFENLVKRQEAWAGRVPYYPGIGLSTSGSKFGAALAVNQILITRKQGTGGFVIFNYGPREASEVLPLLGLGITRPKPVR